MENNASILNFIKIYKYTFCIKIQLTIINVKISQQFYINDSITWKIQINTWKNMYNLWH